MNAPKAIGSGGSLRLAELWKRFSSSSSREEFFHSWLELQCSLISPAVQAILVMENPADGGFVPVSRWPESDASPERLAEISERALEEKCGLLLELPPVPHVSVLAFPRYGLAYPIIMAEKRMLGVVALEVEADADDKLQHAMVQLQWGVAWLELLFRRREVADAQVIFKRLKVAVDLLASVLSADHFEKAAMTFVTELATAMQCERVSLGVLRRGHVQVLAISHSAQFGKRMNLIRAIREAMDEAIVQRQELLYPPPSGQDHRITRNHSALANQFQVDSILTLPLFMGNDYFGALTLERQNTELFGQVEVEFCRSVSALVAPSLETKRLNDRPIFAKNLDSLKQQMSRLFGPHYLMRKLIGLAILALVVFLSLAKGEYRLATETVLEGAVRRIVVAPLVGYIQEAPVRAGDVVAEGQLLCRLDDRDLRLDRLNWLSKRTQLQRQYQDATSKHDQSQANIIKAQLDQANVELELVESKLDRITLKAPFKGYVLTGDLSQRLGGSVEQGEVLFEVAPLDAYRVILEVDERRIGDVRVGQRGSLLLASLPQDRFHFVIEKMTAIATARDGRNFFRVEASLANTSPKLRPGMEGIGKIEMDKRRLISIWTRNFTEWLQLWLWKWI